MGSLSQFFIKEFFYLENIFTDEKVQQSWKRAKNSLKISFIALMELIFFLKKKKDWITGRDEKNE